MTDYISNCELLVKRLKNKGINLLAIDFDQTLIGVHTGGRWQGTAEELALKIRPQFKALVPIAIKYNLNVGIVTFSPQTRVIAAVLKSSLSEAIACRIPIRGNDGRWEYVGDGSTDGKQAHIAAVAEEIMKKCNTANNNCNITRNTTILIDDDRTNIDVAHRERVRAVWFNPNQPDAFMRTLWDWLE